MVKVVTEIYYIPCAFWSQNREFDEIDTERMSGGWTDVMHIHIHLHSRRKISYSCHGCAEYAKSNWIYSSFDIKSSIFIRWYLKSVKRRACYALQILHVTQIDIRAIETINYHRHSSADADKWDKWRLSMRTFYKEYYKKKNCGNATTLNAKCYNGVQLETLVWSLL